MRPVTLNPQNPQSALAEIQRASHENDLAEIAQSFSIIGTVTPTTALNVTSPTLANIANFVATLVQAMQRGGINRTT
jgi:hypothetical protein